MTAFCSPKGLCGLAWPQRAKGIQAQLQRHLGPLDWPNCTPNTATRELLQAYLQGDLLALTRIAIDLHGTAFQLRVWRALLAIAPGQTRSYGEVAKSIGMPGASRAVGNANGANPISLVIPCHRVIQGDGSLGGYAAGRERKRWLLTHEGALQAMA